MKRDPHILVSESPLNAGENYTALCGREIVKAAFVWTDGEIKTEDDFLDKLGMCCRKCTKARGGIVDKPANTLYCYGALDGELVRNQDAE